MTEQYTDKGEYKFEGQPLEKAAGLKLDANKPLLNLLPPSYWAASKSEHSTAMSEWYFYRNTFPKSLGFDAVPILEYGCIKYAAHNWVKGMRWGRLVGAFHRHCNKLINGVWVPRDLNEADEESGKPHGQHAECCRIFLQEYYNQFQKGNLIGENDCAWQTNKVEPVREIWAGVDLVTQEIVQLHNF